MTDNETAPERRCLECGVDISHRHPNAKFCSTKHRNEAAYIRRLPQNRARALAHYYRHHEANKAATRERHRVRRAKLKAAKASPQAGLWSRVVAFGRRWRLW